MIKRLVTLFLLLLVLASATQLGAESASDRVSRFRKARPIYEKQAFKILMPCDHPLIVDELAKVYGGEGDIIFIVGSNPLADEVLDTAVGKEVFARIHHHSAKDRRPHVRIAFITGLGRLGNPISVPFLGKLAAGEKDESVLLEAVRSLTKFKSDDAYDELFKLCKSLSSVLASLAALEGLQGTICEKTTLLLRELYQGKAPNIIRGEALRSLYRRGDSLPKETVAAALDDRDTAVRVVALYIATAEKRTDLEASFIAMFSAPEWEVRSAAIKACAELKIAKAIAPLVELWKNEPGRLGDDIHKALLKITGKSLGPDWRFWDAWLQGLTEPPQAGEKEGEYISYHGVKIKSRNIAFVIDHSGSMEEPASSKAGGYVGEGAVVKDDTRLGFVKAELIRTIKALPSDTWFNVIAFDDKVKAWRSQQARASSQIKQDAAQWVDALKPEGATNIYDALIQAFGVMNPGGSSNAQRGETGPDTVVLLTDGMPCAGAITDNIEILKAIGTINKIRQITIHTIGVGLEAESLLKPLAEHNGGVYKLIAE